jgi:hypothetical protein
LYAPGSLDGSEPVFSLGLSFDIITIAVYRLWVVEPEAGAKVENTPWGGKPVCTLSWSLAFLNINMDSIC